ncbi:MAG: tetratricopeptide repeat protein [Caldimicrobium sp.]
MKKWIILILGIFSLSGCVSALQTEDTTSLEIKVINLETIVKNQDKKLAELEERVSKTEKKVSEEVSTKFIEAQSKLLADVNDLRRDLTLLQSKIEEIQFQREAEGSLQRKTFEDINTRLSSLELKIKELEEKLKNLAVEKPKDISNQTAPAEQPTNNQTLPKETTLNQTISNQTFSPMQKAEEKPKEIDLYQRAFMLYEKGDLKGARSLWEEYLRLYPKGKWVPQTYFYLGEIAFKEKDYETAILEYQRLIDTPGPNPLKPKALLRQAEAFLALKDKKAAEILLKKVIKNYPTTQEAKEAEKRLKTLK